MSFLNANYYSLLGDCQDISEIIFGCVSTNLIFSFFLLLFVVSHTHLLIITTGNLLFNILPCFFFFFKLQIAKNSE